MECAGGGNEAAARFGGDEKNGKDESEGQTNPMPALAGLEEKTRTGNEGTGENGGAAVGAGGAKAKEVKTVVEEEIWHD